MRDKFGSWCKCASATQSCGLFQQQRVSQLFFFPVPFILLRIFSLKVMKCFLYHSVSLKYSSNYLNKRLLPHRNSVSTYTQTSKGKESLMNKIIPRHLAINFTNNRKCYNNSQLVYSMQCSAWDQNLSNSWPLE